MADLTLADLERLETLAKMAAPGPYTILERGGLGYEVDPLEEGTRGSFEYKADAELVCATLNALPGLLAAVRERDALKAELARAKAETLETAAKVADNKLEWARGFFEPDKNNLYNVIAITAAEVAQEIRALAQQPAPEVR